MSHRPEVVSISFCPICGASAKEKGARCSGCGAPRNLQGWYSGEPKPEVVETLALIRSIPARLPRQEHETEEDWQRRVFDFVGHLYLESDAP